MGKIENNKLQFGWHFKFEEKKEEIISLQTI